MSTLNPNLSEAELKEWDEYKKKYEKTYDEEENKKRRKIYFETKKKINEHNERYDKGLETFSMGINHFADKLPEEVTSGCCGAKK